MNNRPKSSLKTKASAALTALLLLAPTTSFAKENNSPLPTDCSFAIIIPEATKTTKKCENGNKNRCYTTANYTKTFSTNTTLTIDLTCTKITETIERHYTPEVMQATLRAMTKDKRLSNPQTYHQDFTHYKNASLIGESKQDEQPTLTFAQLWIDEKSALSINATITGEGLEEADKQLSEILNSIKRIDTQRKTQ